MTENKENTSGGSTAETPRKFKISGGQDIPETLVINEANLSPDFISDLQKVNKDQDKEEAEFINSEQT